MAWRPFGAKPLSKAMLTQINVHLRVTRPQWVKQMLYTMQCFLITIWPYIVDSRSDMIWNGNVFGHSGVLTVSKCRHLLKFRFWNWHLSYALGIAVWMSMNRKSAYERVHFYMSELKINAKFLSLKMTPCHVHLQGTHRHRQFL